jgi:hypothetical protein
VHCLHVALTSVNRVRQKLNKAKQLPYRGTGILCLNVPEARLMLVPPSSSDYVKSMADNRLTGGIHGGSQADAVADEVGTSRAKESSVIEHMV